MHRVPRVIALGLVLLIVLPPLAAFASPVSAHGTSGAPSSLWQPLTVLWGWLSHRLPALGSASAPSAHATSMLKNALAQPAGSPPPPSQSDEGPGADPYGG
jgi:hypothetical protein